MNSAVSRRDSTMSIGEVLAELSTDFPDVSISKIRLWETEGLVEPGRTASGYRRFTAQDVDRLRYAMTLQRDRFWPLRKIRDHLDAVARGAEEAVGSAGGPRAVPALSDSWHGEGSDGSRTVRLSADELSKQAGISPEDLESLVDYGLLQPGASGWYDDVALTIAQAAAELSAYGIEARHLRTFRTAADREVGLVEQVVSPLRAGRAQASRARADDTARVITSVALRLHAALVRAGLTRAGLG